jgi:hypothetical protein
MLLHQAGQEGHPLLHLGFHTAYRHSPQMKILLHSLLIAPYIKTLKGSISVQYSALSFSCYMNNKEKSLKYI